MRSTCIGAEWAGFEGHSVIAAMMRRCGVVVGLVLSLLVLAGPARAGDEAFDQRIMAELEAKDADAARLFREANEARERGDVEGARARYLEVRARVPSFFHAARRLCGVEVRLGQRAEALGHCREALGMAQTPENQSAMARALIMDHPSSAELDEARALAVQAMNGAPDDRFAYEVACEISLKKQDEALLLRCSKALDRLAPAQKGTAVFAIFAALSEGRYDDAQRSLEQARSLGLDDRVLAELEQVIDDATPFSFRAASMGWNVGVGWVGAFALLFALGVGLSRAALRAAEQAPRRASGRAVGMEKRLRQLYAGVLWACCLFYYLSIPLVMVVVLGTGGAFILGFVALGTIPVKLVLIIGIVSLSTVWAMLKSLFVRAREEEPGMRLDLAEHPGLDAVLAEVAGKVGTRKVDAVYLTLRTDLAVMERGGVMRQMRGRTERCLILGAGNFKGMKVVELKSVLAHEYGHFHNEDTAGGGFALAVRRSIFTLVLNLARAGAAAWYNPAWWFVRGFYRVFLMISQGASRLQEVLADRWAVHAYGSLAFERGLSHVLTRSVRFDAHVGATLAEAVNEKVPLVNLYRHKPAKSKDVESAVEEVLSAEPSAYDSHPSPKDRLRWARELDVSPKESSPGDDKPVWSLFSKRRALELRMTDQICDQVSSALGVAIARAEPEESEEG
jgi:tetratricopeptide (TPR) repeat protein